MDTSEPKKMFPLLFIAALATVSAALFIPAGTLNYWQAWAYMAIIFIPAFFVILYFLKTDPHFLVHRMQYREKQVKQKAIIKVASLIFLIGFLIPGLDRRFGWSHVPFEFSIAADIIALLGYILIFLVFKENRYAFRTVQVEKGQKVITTGPYSIVRHPMYVGSLLLYLATPIALGSYWAIPPFLFMVPVLVYRIQDEEALLRRKLPGYKAYCKKTRYRLLPYIW